MIPTGAWCIFLVVEQWDQGICGFSLCPSNQVQKIALGISVFPKSSFGHCEIFKGLIKFTTDLMNFQIFDKNFTIYFALPFSLISPIYELNAGKENNPDPKRFSDSFLKFSKQDIEKGPSSGNLTLFTGSSSIRMWTSLDSDFPEINLLNRGFGGAHLSDLLHYYDRLFTKYHPQRIVLYCGENDLRSGKSVGQVMKDFHALWAKIKMDLPATTLFYLSCKPSPKRISKWNTYLSLNLRIKNLALRDKRLTFVDISPTLLRPDCSFYPGFWKEDNLHLNQAGYDRWTSWIRPTLGLK